MKQIISIVLIIFSVISLITATFTINQVYQENIRLENDLQYRSSLLADGLKESVEPNFINKSDEYLQLLVERYANRQRIAGLAVVDNTGKIIAVSSSLPNAMTKQPQQFASNVMDADKADGELIVFNNKKMYVFATPLHDNAHVVGALLVVQNAAYIDLRIQDIWTSNVLRAVIQAVLLSLAFILIIRIFLNKPIEKLVESLKLISTDDHSQNHKARPFSPLLRPLMKEIYRMQESLLQARLSASEEARVSLEKLDSPWTAERLKQFIKDIIKDRTIVVVSQKEPYLHTKTGNNITFFSPATGVVTALEPIMQATGGTWIAFGGGDADKLVVDENDKIKVPPDNPKYTLKRIWLSDEEIKGFSTGFSSEGIWPLCNAAHVRPVFREQDWEQYKMVNEKYAKAVLNEIKYTESPIVFIQDFQFMLVPKMIKDSRPDAAIGMFWHIPWPNPESFSICPWKKVMLEGMLGSDLIAFHTQLHSNNFIDTVARELEALVDLERFVVIKNEHETLVKPFPISIAFTGTEPSTSEIEKEEQNKKELRAKLNIKSEYIGVGIERLDYVKGLLERYESLDLFFTNHPEYKERLTFIQLAVPSNSPIKAYQEYEHRVQEEINRINNKFKTSNWKPIILLKELQSHSDVNKLYQAANFCLITSLQDGMNLVAKEYIAARHDEKGVLILSQFAGASKELRDSLIINPYNIRQTADAIYTAVTMDETEQKKRMKILRRIVKSNNVYRWAAEFLKTIASLE
jgi:trehalose 6-phosphate synthase